MTLPGNQDFLGKGVSLPFRTDARTGDVAGASGDENVRNSVRMFFSTFQGERVFFEDYGVPRILFSNIDPGTADALEHTVRLGFQKYEPRIVVTDVRASHITNGEMHGIRVSMRYTIRATGRVENEVFFLKKSGEG